MINSYDLRPGNRSCPILQATWADRPKPMRELVTAMTRVLTEAQSTRNWSPCVGGCRRRPRIESVTGACRGRRVAAATPTRCRSAARSGRRRRPVPPRCRCCCYTVSVCLVPLTTSTSFQLPPTLSMLACSRRGSPTFSVHVHTSLFTTGVVSCGSLGHVPPSTSNSFFSTTLCSYKSMKAISHVKCLRDFAYHSY